MIHLHNERATRALGARLADGLRAQDGGMVIALEGELGAGKTALARATITALGHAGVVVSPSYTLLEPYDVAGRRLHHIDLYRLADPGELETIGLRDIELRHDWVLIEWADNGRGFLPPVDLTIVLAYAGDAREARLSPNSSAGRTLVQALELKDSSLISSR